MLDTIGSTINELRCIIRPSMVHLHSRVEHPVGVLDVSYSSRRESHLTGSFTRFALDIL
jgi:hypothetical protein